MPAARATLQLGTKCQDFLPFQNTEIVARQASRRKKNEFQNHHTVWVQSYVYIHVSSTNSEVLNWILSCIKQVIELFGQRVCLLLFMLSLCFKEGSLIWEWLFTCSCTSIPSSQSRKGKKDLVFKLNKVKVMYLILGILYTNTAKFGYIHKLLPLQPTQLFQTSSGRRCF